MMKPFKKIFFSTALIISIVTAYAGGADPIIPSVASTVVPYIDLMGGGAWRDTQFSSNVNFAGTFEDADVTDDTVFTHSSDNWMARGAVGLMFPYNPKISFSSEIGWGWYGEDKQVGNRVQVITVIPNEVIITTTGTDNNKFSYNGFDVLLGAIYNFNAQFDVFGKVGGLILNQTNRDTSIATVTSTIPIVENGTFPSGFDTNITNVLPEVMVGGMWNFSSMFGIEIAYMHAFGQTFLTNFNFPAFFQMENSNPTLKNRAPSINAVLGGVEVRFPPI